MGRKLAMDDEAREALTHVGHSPDTDLLTGAHQTSTTYSIGWPSPSTLWVHRLPFDGASVI